MKNNDFRLVEKYVASFEKLDDMMASGSDPVAMQLSIGKSEGRERWRPARADTPPAALEEIYAKIPRRFPRLYERLVLSYRWAEVDLATHALLPNPPGPGLIGLFLGISGDRGLWESLRSAGFVQFGRAAGGNYDPVCFDMNSKRRSGDFRIVRIDHEEILCNYRVKVVCELAASFYELVRQTIEAAFRRD
jgi:hypothetical protein